MGNVIRILSLALFVTMPGLSKAAVIGDFDLGAFDFDVVSLSPADCAGGCVAAGTSNGIAWSITHTSYWMTRTVTNGSFGFAALPVTTDNLHASGDYTITFAQPISALLVALSNDNTIDAINFGLVASDTQGVSMSGTQVVLDSVAGGLVLFENIDSLTVTNLNTNFLDGYDLAFHAIPQVPLPAAGWLFGAALLSLAGLKNRKVARSARYRRPA
ncbi:MAG: hypothetical protein H6985_17160 [Pseudomonadales bacterium]|nr:hypothetical protein [Halioglobus sp.]MCP5131300.1 hypothetical protein [Pseudomonadales bacterium]